MRKTTSMLALAVLLTAACAAPSEAGGVEEVLDPGQALEAPEGRPVRVAGSLVAGDRVMLCEALLESYPPQCGGRSIELEGADPGDVVGLSRAEGVVWSDFAVTVRGMRRGDVLVVDEVLQSSAKAELGTLEVRFAIVPSPIPASGPVTWLLDVTNGGDGPVTIELNPAVPFDVVLERDGTEAYRFTDGKAFTQSLQLLEVAPGETVGFALRDEPALEPGDYLATAELMASIEAPPLSLPVTVAPRP